MIAGATRRWTISPAWAKRSGEPFWAAPPPGSIGCDCEEEGSLERLKGKRAVVTAAGQGIGRAVAEAFVGEGAQVTATDINEAALASLAGARTRRLDVTDRAAIEALAGELGAVDILFNCVGYVHQGTILECSEK